MEIWGLMRWGPFLMMRPSGMSLTAAISTMR
jgi:hypothetical protein